MRTNIFAGLALGAALFGATAFVQPTQAHAQMDPRTHINRQQGSFDTSWDKAYNNAERYGSVNWHRKLVRDQSKYHGWHWKNGKRVYY